MSRNALFDRPGSSAVLSPDGRYRYQLTRELDGAGGVATFVMLNPSTADADLDDPTINRCKTFAEDWGCSTLRVVNVYALRATNPADLWTVDDPVGPDNDRWIRDTVTGSTIVVAAWGAHARPARVTKVLHLLDAHPVHALRVTKYGAPGHPLYIPRSTPLTPYERPR